MYLSDHFIQANFYDSFGSAPLELGNDFANNGFVDNGLDGEPSGVGQLVDGGGVQGG